MGYTHYWNRKPQLDPAQFAAFAVDAKKIIDLAVFNGISIRGGLGTGSPITSDVEVNFNGDEAKEEDFETFGIQVTMERRSWQPDEPMLFDFCKTGRRPYDVVVQAVLAAAKRHLGDDIVVTSDGRIDEWGDGLKLAQFAVGYGGDFVFIDDELRENRERI